MRLCCLITPSRPSGALPLMEGKSLGWGQTIPTKIFRTLGLPCAIPHFRHASQHNVLDYIR